MTDPRYRHNPDFIPRQIEGELVLIPLKNSAGCLDAVFTLNATAAACWNLLDGQRPWSEVLREMSHQFDAPDGQLATDLQKTVDQLLDIRALEEIPT